MWSRWRPAAVAGAAAALALQSVPLLVAPFPSSHSPQSPTARAFLLSLPPCCQALLAQGADTNQGGPAGELPLVVAMRQEPVDIALVQVRPGLGAGSCQWLWHLGHPSTVPLPQKRNSIAPHPLP